MIAKALESPRPLDIQGLTVSARLPKPWDHPDQNNSATTRLEEPSYFSMVAKALRSPKLLDLQPILEEPATSARLLKPWDHPGPLIYNLDKKSLLL